MASVSQWGLNNAYVTRVEDGIDDVKGEVAYEQIAMPGMPKVLFMIWWGEHRTLRQRLRAALKSWAETHDPAAAETLEEIAAIYATK